MKTVLPCFFLEHPLPLNQRISKNKNGQREGRCSARPCQELPCQNLIDRRIPAVAFSGAGLRCVALLRDSRVQTVRWHVVPCHTEKNMRIISSSHHGGSSAAGITCRVFHSSTSTLLSVEQPAAAVNYLPVDRQRLENALHAWLLCQKLERGPT
jgi:hypothetical protein